MKRFSFPLLFILVPLLSFSLDVVSLKKADGIVVIGGHMELYEDKTCALGIDDILKPEVQASFKPFDRPIPNLGLTRSCAWSRVRITVTEPLNWQLDIGTPYLRRVELYKKEGEKIEPRYSGLLLSPEEREGLGNHYYFPLKLAPGDTAEYYILVEDIMPMSLYFKAGEIEYFFEEDHTTNFFHGLYIGMMLLMVLYNLFLFFTGMDRVYVYYVLYIIFNTLFICFYLGYILEMPYFGRYVFYRMPVLVPALFGVFGLLFTARFLNTRKHAPFLHKVIVAFLYTVFLPVGFALFGYQQESIMMIQYMGLLLCLISFLTGVTVLYRGYRPAKFYVLGFGFYMSGLLILIISDITGTLNDLPALRYSLEIGSCIEAVMLSFAIGDKLNAANKDKQKAQAETLERSLENERLVKEQNTELERKVKERTAEIEHQKEVIEEKNKDITSSIQYAKRIQGALLASDNVLEKNLPEHFVFYKPKDIVSGDFYWANECPSSFVLCVGDCTGHGVPGAFMSLLSTSFLNEITGERQITRPDLVLNTLRDEIIKALNPEGRLEEGKDGLDGVLCSFDFPNKKLEFACSNNPIWIIRDGQLMEFKPDKFPVGMYEGERKPFTLQKLDLQKGDMVYLFTDGYADQFGGEKGKKFKYRQLQELLLANAAASLKDQKTALDAKLEQWKGRLEQVDDILIIGMRIA